MASSASAVDGGEYAPPTEPLVLAEPPGSNRGGAIRDTLGLSSANYVGAALNAARGIVVAKVLGPESYGVWSVLTLILVWTQFADVGLASAVSRQIPIARSEGNGAAAERAASIGFGMKLAASGVVAVGLVLSSVLAQTDVYREGLLVLAGLAGLQAIQQYGATVLLSQRRVGEAARLALTFSAASFVTTCGGAVLSGLRGVWYGLGTALLITGLMYMKALRVKPSLRMSTHELRSYVSIGVPLAALAVLGYNLVNIDQLVVAGLLGSEQLAYYAIALTSGSLLYIIPSSVAAVLGPRLLERWNKPAEARRLGWDPVRLLRDAYWVPVLVSMIALPLAVRLALPAYEPGIPAALAYLPGCYVLGINLGASTYLLALKRQWVNIPIVLGCVAVSAAAEMALVRSGLGLVGVGLGSTLGYCVYTVVHLTVVRLQMCNDALSAIGSVIRLLAPAFGWVAIMLASQRLELVHWIAAVTVYAVVFIVAVIYPHREHYLTMLRRRA